MRSHPFLSAKFGSEEEHGGYRNRQACKGKPARKTDRRLNRRPPGKPRLPRRRGTGPGRPQQRKEAELNLKPSKATSIARAAPGVGRSSGLNRKPPSESGIAPPRLRKRAAERCSTSALGAVAPAGLARAANVRLADRRVDQPIRAASKRGAAGLQCRPSEAVPPVLPASRCVQVPRRKRDCPRSSEFVRAKPEAARCSM